MRDKRHGWAFPLDIFAVQLAPDADMVEGSYIDEDVVTDPDDIFNFIYFRLFTLCLLNIDLGIRDTKLFIPQLRTYHEVSPPTDYDYNNITFETKTITVLIR